MTAAHSVRFGLGVPNGGDFADPLKLASLAREAEDAGWDGFFLWDHVIRRQPWQPMVDPWVSLAAVATVTERIVLGPMVTPLARRRVSVVARQSVTLDRLSGGRLRLGVGLGAPDDEFTRFGEDADPRVRARKLDESLTALEQLWSGETVEIRGEYVVADEVRFSPAPVNGRIPIWVAGGWPGGAPFRRAAHHDGVWPISTESRPLTIEEFADCVTAVRSHRAQLGRAAEPFDACFVDRSPETLDAPTSERIERLADVGMTWWIDSLDDPTRPFERHRARVLAGPPTHQAAAGQNE
ncbi:MAG TPA: LLM class flavin-dependent oxidoreductase [Ilumatobacteraceae bacterium]|nr:LLM class flavin-dependent oxidoreductase [Ilumatobacteraceae bacterium]